jgi:hypothetical protein
VRWILLPAAGLTVPLLLLLVLRLPSLFEPHWYSDEAGYATTAWMTTHGKVLYLTAWNNKPPLLFWIYDLAHAWLGPSQIALHLLSTLTEISALVATWFLARGRLSSRRVWAAMLLTAFFLATPILNGDLALPENFLIGFTPWAMLAVLAALRASTRSRALLLVAVAGGLVGAACLIQQTALADLATAILVLLVVSRRDRWLALVMVAVTAAVGAVVLAPFVAAAGMHNVIFFLVTSYSGYTNQSLHPSALSIVPRAVGGLFLVAGTCSARKWSPERLLPWVWLSALLLAYGLPNRDYLHFLLPAVPAAALLLARVGATPWRAWWSRLGLAGAPLLTSAGIGAGIWLVLMMTMLAQGSLFTVKLAGEHYPAFVGELTGALSPSQYVSIYDPRALAEQQAVDWVEQHHLTGQTAVVWSPDSWAYLLAGLRPVLPEPTIYENSALLGNRALLQRVKSARSVVVVLTSDSYTAYGPILPLLRTRYSKVEASAFGELWIRSDVAGRLPTAEPKS